MASTSDLEDVHIKWMKAAMDMVGIQGTQAMEPTLMEPWNQAEEALGAQEVPVGCVFVRDDKIIASARNRTNQLRNVNI